MIALLRPLVLLLSLITVNAAAAGGDAQFRATRFVLPNGIELVVVVDTRAPVVTHAVAVRAGAAQDPPGIAGVAHFLEHLMYKATATRPSGSFSRTVSRLGGSENAVTTHDTTIYHQRVPKEALPVVMALEADRLGSIRFDAQEAARERDIIVAERRQRIDLSPLNILNELIAAKLFAGSPYARSVLGSQHDIERLTVENAQDFYEHFYGAENLVVVVMGDVEPQAVFELAGKHYGALRRSDSVPVPAALEATERQGSSVELRDRRVTSPAVVWSGFAAVPAGSDGGDAEACEILARILAQGDTSRLYRRLVESDRAALVTDGGTSHTRFGIKIALYALARPGVALDGIERAMSEEIDDIRDRGVSVDELTNARNIIAAADLFERDRQSKLALRYAEGLASGESIAGIELRSARLQAVSAADVQRVARKYFSNSEAVIGRLLPSAAGGTTGAAQ